MQCSSRRHPSACPNGLFQQLVVGGRLVIPIGDSRQQRLKVFHPYRVRDERRLDCRCEFRFRCSGERDEGRFPALLRKAGCGSCRSTRTWGGRSESACRLDGFRRRVRRRRRRRRRRCAGAIADRVGDYRGPCARACPWARAIRFTRSPGGTVSTTARLPESIRFAIPTRSFRGNASSFRKPGEVVEPDPPREPARESVASESVASGDLSVRGVAVTQAPVATPLPSLSTPESKPSITPPRKVSTQPQKPAPEVVPKSVAGELPPKASAPLQRSVTKPAAQPPSAARNRGRACGGHARQAGRRFRPLGAAATRESTSKARLSNPSARRARGQVVYAGSGLIGYGKTRHSEAQRPTAERLCPQRKTARGRRG